MWPFPLDPRSRSATRSRRGAAAVEFAIMLPLLMILLNAIVEIGMAGYQAMQVQVAAEAGALYAANHGIADLAAISQAVTNATTTSGITATPGPSVYCGCTTAAGITSQGSDCTTVCPGNKSPGQYVLVQSSIHHQALMTFLALPLPSTLSGSATMRIN